MGLSPLDEEAIQQVVDEAKKECDKATTSDQLKNIRSLFMGDSSELALAHREIKNIPPASRAQAGKLLGQAKAELSRIFSARTHTIEQQELARTLQEETVDVTVPTQRTPRGARHPLDLLQEEIAGLFVRMGWEVAEGPEVEHEWFNFDALNIDPDHPAREEQDTLYIDSSSIGKRKEDIDTDVSSIPQAHLLLRTHTSPVQARVLVRKNPPVYVVCPGKVFRADELDSTHSPVFHQVEGLAVDKGLTMADLKGTLEYFARSMFGEESKIRLRPSFFPFTEPSAELDLWFPQKKGGAGWIEWGGCGMVNPRVLQACGIDTSIYTGFAFGMGIERTLMLRHGVSDIHDIVEGDIRFSQQFGITGRGQ